jgi:hypothetical protein
MNKTNEDILITRRQRQFYRSFLNNKILSVESSYDQIFQMNDVFADLLLLLDLFHFLIDD